MILMSPYIIHKNGIIFLIRDYLYQCNCWSTFMSKSQVLQSLKYLVYTYFNSDTYTFNHYLLYNILKYLLSLCYIHWHEVFSTPQARNSHSPVYLTICSSVHPLIHPFTPTTHPPQQSIHKSLKDFKILTTDYEYM